MPGKDLVNPCVDCKDAESLFTVRKRQLCRDCFIHFVGSKVNRHMTKYPRPKNLEDPCPQLLLPLSFGVSSSSLLRQLDADLRRQLNKPRPRKTYDLHILVVDSLTAPYDQNYEAVQKAFPMHTYSRVPFHSVFEYVPEMQDLMREYAGPQFADDTSRTDQDRLAAFRATISTATSQADVDSVLLTRLVVGFAQKAGCEAVLWGDSDSRLAAKTLAEVAKGRGAALTWRASDGISPWGLRFEYPLRDWSKAELQQYEQACPELADIVVHDEPPSDNVLTKNLSIDELMMRYVLTQGEKYPGVMANVSRTANKLEASSSDDSTSCALCGNIIGNVKGNTGLTVSSQSGEKQDTQFCYGCMRSRPNSIS
ncbi:hypothetical protein N7510_004117 [Penicillium lagena]|uniref:uncharacterized protein n=1 Tax=Penicillium lagena TaxID=94218 RepID=UPI0025423E38|nr:uncharacterized protein N7510_004117 [Penicillium lagena]KAJ5620133.1 hypothetical protein N7510_004117 [Penicillium lagena]